MKNVNDPLSEKYFQLLKAALTPIPVFRDGYVPNDLVEDAYVMVSPISTTDDSTMNSADTITSMQVGIYTRSFIDSNSTVINDVADIVYIVTNFFMINHRTVLQYFIKNRLYEIYFRWIFDFIQFFINDIFSKLFNLFFIEFYTIHNIINQIYLFIFILSCNFINNSNR